MDEGSTTIALATRLRKRSISAHRHSTTDNNGRTSLIKTKIQKIDGQYKASTTCPITNEQEQGNSSDDQDEPLIVATVPPLVQNSSKYRTRQDIYDDETNDDQQSNSSSLDYSPTHQSESSSSTIVTIQKPIQLLNDNENETINETSLDISTTSSIPTKRSTRVPSEENIQEKPVIIEEPTPQKIKIMKKSNVTKTNSSTAISIEQNQLNNSTNQTSSPLATVEETRSTVEETISKPSTSVDIITKQSQTMNDQSKVKVRLKTIPSSSSQTKPNNKPVAKTTKIVEQKPIKKPTTLQKETVIITKKPTSTVTPTKPVKTSINKPLAKTNNSEKQPARPLSKSIDKKPSDTPDSTTINKSTPVKSIPVTMKRIPKLNPANKLKVIEKPKSSISLTDQKLDTLAAGGNLNNTNKELITLEKNLSNRQRSSPKRRSPNPPLRHPQNNIDTSDPFAPLSPMDLDDSIDNILGKQSSNQRYPSLIDTNQRSASNFSRTNSIGLENTQSQSPLSPGPSSTLYPPPSPPTTLPPPLPSRSIPLLSTAFIDSRHNQPHRLPPNNELPQSLNRNPFSTPPIGSLSRPNSSSNISNVLSIPPPTLISNDYQDSRTTHKSNNIWDPASSDEELDDDSNARRFFQQNMRAVDEELSKVDESNSMTPPLPTDSRTEQLLKRQKKASLGLATNGTTNEEIIVEPSASVDDFECVAMDLDSPKHRTQSESSDTNNTIADSNNSKNTISGAADSKIAELTTASSIDTSRKLTSKNRPLKTTSMTLIDELKNTLNPSSSSKQPDLSPPSRSLSRSRTRSRSRSRTRSHSHSRSRSRSRSSSSSAHKRRSRSRHRSSKRRSNKHYQRHRSNSYDNDNELAGNNNNNNNNNYPPGPMHHQSHNHHHHQPPLLPPHQQSIWPPARQIGGLLPGPPPQPPPPLPYGHQQPVPPLLPHHPYYPPSNRSLMHHQQSVESAQNAGGRFNFQQNHQQRHHPPLMHPNYYPQGPPQPLMQPTPRAHHHPMSRYPPPARPFDLPPHPMPMGNAGPLAPNANYNQYKYESEERLALRRIKRDVTTGGANMNNNNRRGGPQQAGSNGKKKMNNLPKPNTKSSDHQDMDQLFIEREKLLAKLNEISDTGDIEEDQPPSSSSYDKRSISTSHSNQPKPVNSQDDEGEEGEISESD